MEADVTPISACYICCLGLVYLHFHKLMLLCVQQCFCDVAWRQRSCWLDGLMLSSLLISPSDTTTAASSKAPHKCVDPHTHKYTRLFVTLPPLCWPAVTMKRSVTQTAVRAEGLRPTSRHTLRDRSEDTGWFPDPSTYTVSSTLLSIVFIFHHWQVKLHFI